MRQKSDLASFSGEIKEVFIDVDQARLFCRVLGKGEPLVIIHGGPGLSQDYLLPQLKKLAENNLVIFYDQRGSGESIGSIDPKSIQMSNFVNDLDEIRKAFGFKQISILGHSFGGLLAMHYAIAFPHFVNKLILLSSAPSCSEDYALLVKEWSLRMAPYMEELDCIKKSKAFEEGEPLILAKYFRIIYGRYCFDAKKVDEINFIMSRKANIDGLKTHSILKQNFFSQPFNLQSHLQQVRCKTLIIHGDVDTVLLRTAQNIHKNIPNSKLIIIKNCGHFPYVEAPQELFTHLHAFLNVANY